MHLDPKQQKITRILTAAVLLLLALLILGLLLGRGGKKKTPETEATPVPVETVTVTLAPTAAPTPTPTPGAAAAPDTVTIGGKTVEKDAESFTLSGKMLTREDRDTIASLTKLTTLSLSKCGVSDLTFLRGMRDLRTLYLPDNAIRDLSALGELTGLRTLYLDRNPLTDLTPLNKLTGLGTLSLQGVEVTSYALEDLKKALPSCKIFCDSVTEAARPVSVGGQSFTEAVETLDLSNRGLTDLSVLSGCRELRSLNLTGNKVGDLRLLSQLPRLMVLNLTDTGLTDDKLEFLKTLQNLTYLNIEQNPALSSAALTALAEAMPNCRVIHDTIVVNVNLGGQIFSSDQTELDLSGWNLADLRGLENFQGLERLILNGNHISDLSPLRDLGAMLTLEVSNNLLSDISPLEGHRTLKRLVLSWNGIDDVTPLNGLVWLEELDLSHNRITDVSALNTCVRLRWLDLTGNAALTGDQIRALQEGLPGCRIVTDADLSMPEPTPEPPRETPVPLIPEFPDPIPIGGPEG